MIFVLAGKQVQFDFFLSEAGLPYGCVNMRYLSDARKMLGHNKISVVRYGTWFNRTDLDEIDDVIRYYKASGRYI
jgi:hypothetical protein